ncbi:hypothetical protein Poli38472_012497 [Pythium oligandrum]|uniref:Uncharacterized protein n=1 Tax=Pythium oligandrum TaxID=41045 RepID=A0A8K1FLP9_PYTOL|nr:hypothetical protein Poli38472_012497 [Pythium oligandrum]|eukprot:TMW67381.1 hypothetical protein Poli38472_012497 [Pythium oligandrum]
MAPSNSTSSPPSASSTSMSDVAAASAAGSVRPPLKQSTSSETEGSAPPTPEQNQIPSPASSSTASRMIPTLSPATSSLSSSTMMFDRELFQKLEDVNSEIERISRMSTDLPFNRELEQVQAEFKRVERDSCIAIQSQKELLDKIERHERSSFRRYFVFNRDQRIESLKTKLWERMAESTMVDAELQRLERQSVSLQDTRRTTFVPLGMGMEQGDATELSWKMEELEREKQDILSNLLTTVATPDVQQLNTRIAMFVSEMRACESIQKQVEKCASMYRQSLQQLQTALSTIMSPSYGGTLKEFVTGPYLLAVEAGHSIEAASHVIQPEARRRYRNHAPELLNVRPPKFPQAIVDFAKRARVNYDRKSSLSVEGTRKLRAGENVIVLMHRIVIQKLEVIITWKTAVEKDLERATDTHRRLESRLHQQMAVAARSVSA